MNYNHYCFRCSMLPTLMTNSRSKDELSETTKDKLREIWIEEEYGRVKEVSNKFTEKGIVCEDESITLLNTVKGKSLTKNIVELGNEYFTGTPDLIDGEIWDIKTSWDIWTFMKSTENAANKSYAYQILGYLDLTGLRTGHIAYCLVDTPPIFIRDETYKLSFTMTEESKEFKEKEAQIKKNMTFADIPKEKRVKVYDFTYDETLIKEVKERVIKWRNYLNSLSL